ncbi:MAG: hypothetical protein ACYDBB_24680 [Armatimonadota bacterium]
MGLALGGAVVGALGSLFGGSKPPSNPVLDELAKMTRKYSPEYMARLNQYITSGITPELLAQQRKNEASIYNDETLASQNYQRAMQGRGLGKSQLMASGLAGLFRGFGGMRAANRANIYQQLAQQKWNALQSGLGYSIGQMPQVANMVQRQNEFNDGLDNQWAQGLGTLSDLLAQVDWKKVLK